MPTKGRVILITGAASGIGQAIARAAAAAGDRIVLGDVDAPRLDKTAAELSSQGASVQRRICDVRKMTDIESLVELCRDAFGEPDVLFANAGIEGNLGAPWEASEEEFANVIDVNLTGV